MSHLHFKSYFGRRLGKESCNKRLWKMLLHWLWPICDQEKQTTKQNKKENKTNNKIAQTCKGNCSAVIRILFAAFHFRCLYYIRTVCRHFHSAHIGEVSWQRRTSQVRLYSEEWKITQTKRKIILILLTALVIYKSLKQMLMKTTFTWQRTKQF